MEPDNKYREAGKYFGYPKCCIDAFILDTPEALKERNPKWNDTGFIPCPECLKIAATVRGLFSLVKCRIHRQRFPISSYADCNTDNKT